MTTFDTVPSFKEFALLRVSMLAQKRARKVQEGRASYRVNAVLSSVVRVMLHLAGFSLLTIAAWQWNIIAGLTVAGISCFVISTLMTSDTPDSETEDRRAPDMRTGR
jgi:hypothetical protein